MIYRKTTLFEQGLNCIILLSMGISLAPFLPPGIKNKLFTVQILLLIAVLAASIYHDAKHGKEKIKREQKDERNQMILERSAWYCHQVEDWLLLVLFVVFALHLDNRFIAYTLYWVLIGRHILSFCIRWWLNRKY